MPSEIAGLQRRNFLDDVPRNTLTYRDEPMSDTPANGLRFSMFRSAYPGVAFNGDGYGK
ncbi:hypothetical protein [Rhizobium herbae]